MIKEHTLSALNTTELFIIESYFNLVKAVDSNLVYRVFVPIFNNNTSD